MKFLYIFFFFFQLEKTLSAFKASFCKARIGWVVTYQNPLALKPLNTLPLSLKLRSGHFRKLLSAVTLTETKVRDLTVLFGIRNIQGGLSSEKFSFDPTISSERYK